MIKIQCKYKRRYTLLSKGQLLRSWNALLALSTFGSDKWFKRQTLWAVASSGSFNRVYKTFTSFCKGAYTRGVQFSQPTLLGEAHKRRGNTESRKTLLINLRQAVSRETIKLKPKITTGAKNIVWYNMVPNLYQPTYTPHASVDPKAAPTSCFLYSLWMTADSYYWPLGTFTNKATSVILQFIRVYMISLDIIHKWRPF